MSSITAKPSTQKKAQVEGYEFGGPVGVLGATIGLPISCYLLSFLCNDVSGCPIPSLLSPSTLTIEKLKNDIAWPSIGLRDLFDMKVTAIMLAYALFSAVVHRLLPGKYAKGVPLSSGHRLTYKLNAFSSTTLTLFLCLTGTILQGADFPMWTFIWDNNIKILSANACISYTLATFVYIRSFTVNDKDPENRELTKGGHTGNMLYDWFIGRELNPRVTIPIVGQVDIKAFVEMRLGLLGWLLFNSAFAAHQYKVHGYISDSMILVTTFQLLYVIDAQWMESAILTTIDITTDGFGFMLAFGNLVWIPFTFSLQARYLAVFPVDLGVYGTVGVLSVLASGYYVFRSSNNEKNRFRTNPSDPRISHLKYLKTESGSKLLVSGWWGRARNINYLGDWIMAWSYCLPTVVSGYMVQRQTTIFEASSVKRQIFQGEARGWGMIITYFYIIYFGIFLIHRERRDEKKCMKKYGKDWKRYRELVPSRIIPGIY